MGCAASSNVHPDPNQSSKPKHTPGSVVHGKRGQALLRAGGSLDPEKLQLSDPKDSAADLPKLEVNSQSTAVQASGRTEPAQSFRWRKGRLLGRGTFGSVFLCLVENTGGFMAVKEVPFSHDNIKEIQVIAEEISMVRSCKHRHIVQYQGTQMGEGVFYIFTEWVPGGSLEGVVNKFTRLPVVLIKNYTYQILQGLRYLHNRHIAHRDIKAANILLDDQGVIKLADFGASRRLRVLEDGTKLSSSTNRELHGTPYYMAPEVIRQKVRDETKSDIWSLGCTVFHLATGEPPWKQKGFKGAQQLLSFVATTKQDPPLPPDMPALEKELADFLKLCFNRNPAKRPSAEQLLQHKLLEGAFRMVPQFSSTATVAARPKPFSPNTVSLRQEGSGITADDVSRAIGFIRQHSLAGSEYGGGGSVVSFANHPLHGFAGSAVFTRYTRSVTGDDNASQVTENTAPRGNRSRFGTGDRGISALFRTASRESGHHPASGAHRRQRSNNKLHQRSRSRSGRAHSPSTLPPAPRSPSSASGVHYDHRGLTGSVSVVDGPVSQAEGRGYDANLLQDMLMHAPNHPEMQRFLAGLLNQQLPRTDSHSTGSRAPEDPRHFMRRVQSMLSSAYGGQWMANRRTSQASANASEWDIGSRVEAVDSPYTVHDAASVLRNQAGGGTPNSATSRQSRPGQGMFGSRTPMSQGGIISARGSRANGVGSAGGGGVVRRGLFTRQNSGEVRRRQRTEPADSGRDGNHSGLQARSRSGSDVLPRESRSTTGGGEGKPGIYGQGAKEEERRTETPLRGRYITSPDGSQQPYDSADGSVASEDTVGRVVNAARGLSLSPGQGAAQPTDTSPQSTDSQTEATVVTLESPDGAASTEYTGTGAAGTTPKGQHVRGLKVDTTARPYGDPAGMPQTAPGAYYKQNAGYNFPGGPPASAIPASVHHAPKSSSPLRHVVPSVSPTARQYPSAMSNLLPSKSGSGSINESGSDTGIPGGSTASERFVGPQAFNFQTRTPVGGEAAHKRGRSDPGCHRQEPVVHDEAWTGINRLPTIHSMQDMNSPPSTDHSAPSTATQTADPTPNSSPTRSEQGGTQPSYTSRRDSSRLSGELVSFHEDSSQDYSSNKTSSSLQSRSPMQVKSRSAGDVTGQKQGAGGLSTMVFPRHAQPSNAVKVNVTRGVEVPEGVGAVEGETVSRKSVNRSAAAGIQPLQLGTTSPNGSDRVRGWSAIDNSPANPNLNRFSFYSGQSDVRLSEPSQATSSGTGGTHTPPDSPRTNNTQHNNPPMGGRGGVPQASVGHGSQPLLDRTQLAVQDSTDRGNHSGESPGKGLSAASVNDSAGSHADHPPLVPRVQGKPVGSAALGSRVSTLRTSSSSDPGSTPGTTPGTGRSDSSILLSGAGDKVRGIKPRHSDGASTMDDLRGDGGHGRMMSADRPASRGAMSTRSGVSIGSREALPHDSASNTPYNRFGIRGDTPVPVMEDGQEYSIEDVAALVGMLQQAMLLQQGSAIVGEGQRPEGGGHMLATETPVRTAVHLRSPEAQSMTAGLDVERVDDELELSETMDDGQHSESMYGTSEDVVEHVRTTQRVREEQLKTLEQELETSDYFTGDQEADEKKVQQYMRERAEILMQATLNEVVPEYEFAANVVAEESVAGGDMGGGGSVIGWGSTRFGLHAHLSRGASGMISGDQLGLGSQLLRGGSFYAQGRMGVASRRDLTGDSMVSVSQLHPSTAGPMADSTGPESDFDQTGPAAGIGRPGRQNMAVRSSRGNRRSPNAVGANNPRLPGRRGLAPVNLTSSGSGEPSRLPTPGHQSMKPPPINTSSHTPAGSNPPSTAASSRSGGAPPRPAQSARPATSGGIGMSTSQQRGASTSRAGQGGGQSGLVQTASFLCTPRDGQGPGMFSSAADQEVSTMDLTASNQFERLPGAMGGEYEDVAGNVPGKSFSFTHGSGQRQRQRGGVGGMPTRARVMHQFVSPQVDGSPGSSSTGRSPPGGNYSFPTALSGTQAVAGGGGGQHLPPGHPLGSPNTSPYQRHHSVAANNGRGVAMGGTYRHGKTTGSLPDMNEMVKHMIQQFASHNEQGQAHARSTNSSATTSRSGSGRSTALQSGSSSASSSNQRTSTTGGAATGLYGEGLQSGSDSLQGASGDQGRAAFHSGEGILDRTGAVQPTMSRSGPVSAGAAHLRTVHEGRRGLTGGLQYPYNTVGRVSEEEVEDDGEVLEGVGARITRLTSDSSRGSVDDMRGTTRSPPVGSDAPSIMRSPLPQSREETSTQPHDSPNINIRTTATPMPSHGASAGPQTPSAAPYQVSAVSPVSRPRNGSRSSGPSAHGSAEGNGQPVQEVVPASPGSSTASLGTGYSLSQAGTSSPGRRGSQRSIVFRSERLRPGSSESAFTPTPSRQGINSAGGGASNNRTSPRVMVGGPSTSPKQHPRAITAPTERNKGLAQLGETGGQRGQGKSSFWRFSKSSSAEGESSAPNAQGSSSASTAIGSSGTSGTASASGGGHGAHKGSSASRLPSSLSNTSRPALASSGSPQAADANHDHPTKAAHRRRNTGGSAAPSQVEIHPRTSNRSEMGVHVRAFQSPDTGDSTGERTISGRSLSKKRLNGPILPTEEGGSEVSTDASEVASATTEGEHTPLARNLGSRRRGPRTGVSSERGGGGSPYVSNQQSHERSHMDHSASFHNSMQAPDHADGESVSFSAESAPVDLRRGGKRVRATQSDLSTHTHTHHATGTSSPSLAGLKLSPSIDELNSATDSTDSPTVTLPRPAPDITRSERTSNEITGTAGPRPGPRPRAVVVPAGSGGSPWAESDTFSPRDQLVRDLLAQAEAPVTPSTSATHTNPRSDAPRPKPSPPPHPDRRGGDPFPRIRAPRPSEDIPDYISTPGVDLVQPESGSGSGSGSAADSHRPAAVSTAASSAQRLPRDSHRPRDSHTSIQMEVSPDSATSRPHSSRLPLREPVHRRHRPDALTHMDGGHAAGPYALSTPGRSSLPSNSIISHRQDAPRTPHTPHDAMLSPVSPLTGYAMSDAEPLTMRSESSSTSGGDSYTTSEGEED